MQACGGAPTDLLAYRAVHLLASRPDLFLLRSFNVSRVLPLLRFIAARPLSRTGKAPAIVGLAITAVELGFFYWPIMVLAILFCLQVSARGTSGRTHSVGCAVHLCRAILPHLFPAEVQLSHRSFVRGIRCRFHRSRAKAVVGEVMEPLRSSAWRRRALYVTLAFFFYIQVEWMWIRPGPRDRPYRDSAREGVT